MLNLVLIYSVMKLVTSLAACAICESGYWMRAWKDPAKVIFKTGHNWDLKRLCLGIRYSDSEAQMLLDQSVMWLRKVTNLWCDSKMIFLSNDYTNPNANPKILTTLTLILTNPHGAFESFCVLIFCDFIRNYFLDSESECRTPRHSDLKKPSYCKLKKIVPL